MTGRGRTLAIHCCYHKCMTLYFETVLSAFCEEAGLVYLNDPSERPECGAADVLLSNHSNIDLPGINRKWRASHMVRDPRDLMVSAYFYHLRTDEEWCARPSAANDDLPGDVSYQQHLRALGREDGLMYEMNHVSGWMADKMRQWEYDNPRVLELRFEDVLGNEEFWFERIFNWYGFDDERVAVAGRIAGRLSLGALSPGATGLRHRNRNSRPGYWRDYFTDRLRSAFKQRHGSTLVALGYEESLDW